MWLRHYPDLYGYRGCNQHNTGVFLLSPWEFVTHWECIKLPAPAKGHKLSRWCDEDETEYEPNPESEDCDLLFFPVIPGEVQLRDLWYMRKRKARMVPAPSNAPMPDKQNNKEAKARVLAVYLRPWTLDAAQATAEVPHIVNLDIIRVRDFPEVSRVNHSHKVEEPVRRRLLVKTGDREMPTRSFASAWKWYVRGNVVSQNAARIITQFMATCCGKTSRREDDDISDEDTKEKMINIPDNALSLERVHSILDQMSQETVKQKSRPQKANTSENGLHDSSDDDEDVDAKALQQSSAMHDAMQLTAKLWARTAKAWPEEPISKDMTTLSTDATVSENSNPSKNKKKTKPAEHQRRAYMKWNEACVKDWLKLLAQEKEPPNSEQMQFLNRVIDRCRKENQAFKDPSCKQYLDEPVRDCLLGLPGAGKSTCIKLVRRFFEECLHWEDGIQFQFLASQNTMAALIGGATVHTWGCIPVNAIDAAQKVHTKGADADIDDLFLNACGMRWIIIDEISTVSPGLLGLLDAYLRRACCRHPYACVQRRRRPFGGINIVFAGDFWQLPPVRANAIFSNPWKTGCYSSEEQKILKMFWIPGDEDGIQKTFVLTKPMRTKDAWLCAVLNAERYGQESWEMYCFIHGFPTRNPGTWLPSTCKPMCGNTTCTKLADEIWPTMWERGGGTWDNWLLRRQMECEKCKKERVRRCCVLRANNEEDAQRYLDDPFASAAYVHPFRHPSFHATQLRAIIYAKTKKRRLLWVTAYDKLVSNNLACSKDKEELRKASWLRLHDRRTAGLPGLLPLVLNLPIRFTESLGKTARKQGVFKHSRGVLCGWQLPPEEENRIEALEDPEVVLQKRPLALHIEVDTASKHMPLIDGRRIFTLKVQSKQWSLDSAGAIKIQRWGFPIVPDFGGTAHAYCGSTMDAAIGDLLSWNNKPRLEDMLKAYIIKSRIREAERLLIVQPYNPHLFRQGILPGPGLLLDVLQKKIEPVDAKTAWKNYEKDKKERTASTGDWLTSQQLPCRRCTDRNNGIEVWKPISSFSTAHNAEELFSKVLQKGQDLVCAKCIHTELKWNKMFDDVVLCDSCGRLQARCKYDIENRTRWETCSTDMIHCLTCLGITVRRSKAEFVFCSGECQRQVPDYQFVDDMILHWRRSDAIVEAKCARCVLRSRPDIPPELIKCFGCNKSKPIQDFGPVTAKQYLAKDSCFPDLHFPGGCFSSLFNKNLLVYRMEVSVEISERKKYGL